MVKRKIEWLSDAKLDLKDILNCYNERNGSVVYSKNFIKSSAKAFSSYQKIRISALNPISLRLEF